MSARAHDSLLSISKEFFGRPLHLEDEEGDVFGDRTARRGLGMKARKTSSPSKNKERLEGRTNVDAVETTGKETGGREWSERTIAREGLNRARPTKSLIKKSGASTIDPKSHLAMPIEKQSLREKKVRSKDHKKKVATTISLWKKGKGRVYRLEDG